MRVIVDHDRCQGHGRCYDLAPEVFGADDEGYVVLLAEGDLPDELVEPARKGVLNCPEQALTLEG